MVLTRKKYQALHTCTTSVLAFWSVGAWERGQLIRLLQIKMSGHQFHNHCAQILHTFTLITYHPEKYVMAMVLVLQNTKVVVDWTICCDCRAIYSVLSIVADFLFLCDTLVQHILSKVYWWGDIYKSKQQGLQ